MNIPNIDTLCATIDIHNYGYNDIEQHDTADLIIKLEQAKCEAKEKTIDNMNYKHIIQIGNQAFQIIPNGSRGYAYLLHNDCYEVKLSQYRSGKESFYPVFVRIKSECLWSMGAEKAWNVIKEWTIFNIGVIKANKINRIDLCCHTDELQLDDSDIETFEGRYLLDTIYRFRRKLSTIMFGSGTTGKMIARIYNKTLEVMQKKQKLWFLDLWKDKGLNPDKVWNVEFELSRSLMKELKLESVEDTFESLKSLWLYATKSWLVKKNLDRTRIENCTIDERWESIQLAFNDYESKGLIQREKQLEVSAFALIPGTIGNITSFAARADITDIDEIFKMIKSQGAKYLNRRETSYKEVIEDKMSILIK